jgi:hypothetical protein
MLDGHGDGLIDACHGQYADRTSGAVHKTQIRRRQILHAIAKDRVGMAAAELHQPIVARGIDGRGNGSGQTARELAIAELVDVLHCRWFVHR